ncbi:MAG: hypothetical protein ACLFMV_12685 [Spirochaetaceae bacterium]
MLRFNPHFLAIVLEGGFDDEGTFFYIPVSGLQSVTELFREQNLHMFDALDFLAELTRRIPPKRLQLIRRDPRVHGISPLIGPFAIALRDYSSTIILLVFVLSIVDRFLEHGRAFYFHNGGR